MPARRSEDQGLQPGRHPSPDHRKVELVGRSPCPGHGMGCKGGIHRARNTETASKVSWAIRQIHLPHWSRRNRKAPANPPGTSLPTLAQNQAENRMSRVQGDQAQKHLFRQLQPILPAAPDGPLSVLSGQTPGFTGKPNRVKLTTRSIKIRRTYSGKAEKQLWTCP